MTSAYTTVMRAKLTTFLGTFLDYAMIVTDTGTFTEPVALGKHWVWVPGVEVGIYDCVVGE